MSEQKQVLIVDDEPKIHETLEALLFPEGHELLFAGNGPEALDQLEELEPDCILLDVMMPDVDGFELCQIIKNDERWQHIPVILVTALNRKKDLFHGLNMGADDFLSKPVNSLELIARVRSMLRIKEQYDLLEHQRRELEATLRLREELARVNAVRLQELELLHKIGLHLMNSLDTNYILELISWSALELIPPAARCVMHFLSDDEQHLVPVVVPDEEEPQSIRPRLGNEEVMWEALQIQEAIYIPRVQSDSTYHFDFELYDMQSLLANPMIVDKRSIGTLSVDAPEPEAFEVSHRRILSILASQLAIAIMKARLFRELGGSMEQEETSLYQTHELV